MKEILGIISWICAAIIYIKYRKDKKNNNKQIKESNEIQTIYTTKYKYIDLSKFQTNGYVMTKTELLFYKELRKVTDKLELIIFPQVQLERLINVYDDNFSDRNRIKSRSIDYTIVDSINCKVICCIELDDYTHNYDKVKETDEFKNSLFKKVKIPLYRIKVNSTYNLEELENKIKENLILQ